MKKTKKALASLAIASMALTMIPFNAFAAVTTTRIAGNTASQTAVQIAEQTGWTGTAILASSTSYGMVDALTAGPLASYLKAPILLTGADNTLDADTKAELTKLAVNTVYVTSGTAVIKQGVLDELAAMNINVVKLGGFDRAATSVNIASKMTGVTKVAVANGLQDALSIAAVASAANQPILLTDKNVLPVSVEAFLAANPAITSSDVIGGTGIISDAVKASLPNATRYAGYTAYDTNNQVIQGFAANLKFDNVYVANGVTGIDALAGAPLAAQTKSPIVLTDGTVPAAATFVYGKSSAGTVVTALGGTAVVPEAVRVGVATGVLTPAQGDLSVTSVSATTANSFKVAFNKAPADTSKVVFTVNNGSAVTVSATWNAAKTEATLTSSANYVAGTYTIAVKNDATELGTSTVIVSEQKVAKIDITATKLGVTTVGGVQTGYATYKIYDQYGVDITSSALANNVQFQTGVGTIEYGKGLLKVSPAAGLNLLTFTGGIVVTANDQNSGVSTTATLMATSQIGTLSDITLTTLTNADGKVLTAGDSTTIFYAGYEAKDLSGNATTNYTMLQQGLIFQTGTQLLTSSCPNVTAELIQDPADSTKGLIEVKATAAATQIDMPVVITAMTWTGKTSQLSTTLKKQAEVNMLTLYAPSYAIAHNESKVIPFSAVDQNGVAVTKYVDLVGDPLSPNVTLTGCYFVLNNDGTASIKNTAVPNLGTTSIPAVLSAVTKTGKYSSITINIQKQVKADTLTLDSTVLLSNMQVGATQKADFGWDKGGFSVKDQYGRAIDLTTHDKNPYTIRVTPADPLIVNATADGVGGELTNGATQVTVTAVGVGTTTVKFELIMGGLVVDTKSQTFSTLADKDIKDYSITQLENPIYIINSDAAISAQEDGFKANPKVYGKTAAGAKVLLANTPILGANSTSANFTLYKSVAGVTSPYDGGAYDSLRIVANTLADPAQTEATGTITATLIGADGMMHTVSTPVKSSKAKPVAASVDVKVKTETPGITRDVDTVTITAANLAPGQTYETILGTTLAKFNADGTAGAQKIYFAPVDQYGTTASNMAMYSVIAGGTELNTHTLVIGANGAITAGTTVAADDYITISASTTSGLIKTIKIEFK